MTASRFAGGAVAMCLGLSYGCYADHSGLDEDAGPPVPPLDCAGDTLSPAMPDLDLP